MLKITNLFLILFLTVGFSNKSALAETAGLNFQEADIRAVIEAVSQATSKNFIIDPRVKGRVTLVSPADIDSDDLYDVFLSILKVHGFIAIEDTDTGVVRVLPANEARTEAELAEQEKGPADEVLVKIIKIENTQAAQLVPILRPLISKTGHLAAHVGSNNIVVTDTRSNIEKLEKIVKKMDGISESDLKIIKLKNAAATDVVSLLADVLQKNTGTESKAITGFTMVAEERTNSVILSGSPAEIKKATDLLQELDSPVNVQSGTAVIKLKYALAKDIVEIINKVYSEQSDTKKPAAVSSTQISVDEKTNSVVVIGPPKDVAKIRRIVAKLDVKRTQIMVEALIVEMSADKSKQLGIQWGGYYDDGGSDTPSLDFPVGIGRLVGSVKSGNHLTFGLVARALAEDADANLISAPSLLTLENEEAEIEIGREVPFLTGTYTSTGNSSNPDNPFTTISRENVGLKLKITPQLNKGGTIKLAIEQEFSNILPGAQAAIGASDVVTSKRLIKTNVLVKDGYMIVLGGLIDDNVREGESNTPGLSKIPLLGNLFRDRSTTKEKRNLMIFIRPYIVRNDKVSNQLTGNRYNYIRNLQLQRRKQGVTLMPGESQPLIKNLYGTAPGAANAKPDMVHTTPKAKARKNRIKPFYQNKGEDYDVLNPSYDN